MEVVVSGASAVSNTRPSAIGWKSLAVLAMVMLLCAVVFVDPAHAGTGAGGVGAAQTRITSVAAGWQGIVSALGVMVLIIAWMVIGYQIAFNGKTMKDMVNPMIGSTVAGLAPVLVAWLFS